MTIGSAAGTEVHDYVVVGCGAAGGPAAAERASAAILADAAGPPSLAQVLPRPRRPSRPTAVQEIR